MYFMFKGCSALCSVPETHAGGGFTLTCAHNLRGREKGMVDYTLAPKVLPRSDKCHFTPIVLNKASHMAKSAISTLPGKSNKSPEQ